MSQQKTQSRKYEDNYTVLEQITDSLNKDEIGIDDLVEKTREALDAARTCMDILNHQKGEFQKLETEFSQLLQGAVDEPQNSKPPQKSKPPQPEPEMSVPPISEETAPYTKGLNSTPVPLPCEPPAAGAFRRYILKKHEKPTH